MYRRKDRGLQVEGDVELAKAAIGGEKWRGLQLMPGASFRILDARRFVTFRSFPDHCNWTLFAPPGSAAHVSVVKNAGGEELGSRTFVGEGRLITIPWPKSIAGQVDLLVANPAVSPAAIIVAGHRALSRQWLFEMAIGTGVEIGPGPKPQILPAENRKVSYVEQMPPEEWNKLYNVSGKYPVQPELWDNYVVGDASDLPFEDGTLDFIFGSHVFEHLANPLGHLRRWHGKLRQGGKILCVVPDLGGTHDAVQERSTLAEWLDELEGEVWEPTERHYCRHLRRSVVDEHVRETMKMRRSIHAHYYDNINCRDLLDYAVRHLGFADYAIEHTPNHKDFHFVLQKP